MKKKTYLSELIIATLATVLGGLVLAAIPKTRSFFTGLFIAIGEFFEKMWNVLISRWEIPWIFILFLILLTIPTLIRIFRLFVPKSEIKPSMYVPKEIDYDEDEFFGVIWRWNSDEAIGYCPTCQTRVIYKLGYNGRGIESSLYCETCRRTLTTLDGDRQDVLGRVARQIERKLNTGEWKQVVENKKKPRI